MFKKTPVLEWLCNGNNKVLLGSKTPKTFLSSFHVAVDGLVKNCQEEISIFHCDAHGGFNTEGLEW